jgi:hypothetical protein
MHYRFIFINFVEDITLIFFPDQELKRIKVAASKMYVYAKKLHVLYVLNFELIYASSV